MTPRGCIPKPVPFFKLTCLTHHPGCLPRSLPRGRAPHLDEEGLAIAVAPGEDGVDGGRDAPAIADAAGAGRRRAPAVQQPVVVTCAAGRRHGETHVAQGMGEEAGRKALETRIPLPSFLAPALRTCLRGAQAAPAPAAPLRGGRAYRPGGAGLRAQASLGGAPRALKRLRGGRRQARLGQDKAGQGSEDRGGEPGAAYLGRRPGCRSAGPPCRPLASRCTGLSRLQNMGGSGLTFTRKRSPSPARRWQYCGWLMWSLVLGDAQGAPSGLSAWHLSCKGFNRSFERHSWKFGFHVLVPGVQDQEVT